MNQAENLTVHGSLVILKMLQMVRCGPVWSGVVLQVVRCGQVRSGVAGAVNSQTVPQEVEPVFVKHTAFTTLDFS